MAAEIEKGGVFFFAVDLQQERGDSCYLFVHGFGCCGAGIRPPIPLEIPSMERDPAQLRRVYETGRAVAQIQIDKIAAYVEESKAAPEE